MTPVTFKTFPEDIRKAIVYIYSMHYEIKECDMESILIAVNPVILKEIKNGEVVDAKITSHEDLANFKTLVLKIKNAQK